MQGTLVMLMALSGLGCHHKSCAPVSVAACYSSCYSSDGCYATTGYASAQCYSTPVVADCCPTSYVAPSCYSACYSSCYSGGYTGAYESCYSYSSGYYGSSCYGGHGHKHRRGLFAGLCGRRRQASCNACDFPVADYSSCYGGSYAPAVYGSYTPVYGAAQSYAVDTGAAIAPAVAPAAAPAAAAPEAPTEPVPPPTPAPAAPTPGITPPPAPAPAAVTPVVPPAAPAPVTPPAAPEAPKS